MENSKETKLNQYVIVLLNRKSLFHVNDQIFKKEKRNPEVWGTNAFVFFKEFHCFSTSCSLLEHYFSWLQIIQSMYNCFSVNCTETLLVEKFLFRNCIVKLMVSQ